ncbi:MULTISPECIES: hypothetical protein [unclassified Wolbachia]
MRYIMRGGCQWSKRFSAWKTVYDYFLR